jgi:hypothetical protein
MNKRYIGLGLIGLAFLLAKYLNLNSLSTANIAVLMGFGAMSWIGVSMLMSSLVSNPSGPDFKMWKMLLNGVLGLAALIVVVLIGITDTNNHVKKELKDYGVTTDAVIVKKDYTTLPAKRGKINYIYYLTVQFQDQNGDQQQVKSEVQKFEYINANSGRPLKIKYSSRNQKIHQLIFK